MKITRRRFVAFWLTMVAVAAWAPLPHPYKDGIIVGIGVLLIVTFVIDLLLQDKMRE